jgi:hypothetical protein
MLGGVTDKLEIHHVEATFSFSMHMTLPIDSDGHVADADTINWSMASLWLCGGVARPRS